MSTMDSKEGWATVSSIKIPKLHNTTSTIGHETSGKAILLISKYAGGSQKSQTPCRFFAQGFCGAGSACPFIHTTRANIPVCDFFVGGKCKYGNECGLLHDQTMVKESERIIHRNESQSPLNVFPRSKITTLTDLNTEGGSKFVSNEPFGKISFAKSAAVGIETKQPPFHPSSVKINVSESSLKSHSSSPLTGLQTILSFEPSKSNELCAFAMVGRCRYGELCRNIHGLQCPRCLRYCLHPHDVDKNEEHIEYCLGKTEPEAPTDMNTIDCGICLEKVALKEDPRFGLMNCDHAFCLNCIRTWRSKHSMSDLATKSCPLCRTVTFFVIPSSTWTTNKVEKEKIVDSYKRKVKEIDCKHYNYGDGNCPFGSSCFYAHRSREGTRGKPLLRSYFDKDEKIRVIRETRLSDFIDFQLKPQNKGN